MTTTAPSDAATPAPEKKTKKQLTLDAVATEAAPEVPVVEYGAPGTVDYVALDKIDIKTVKNSRLREPSEEDIALLAESIKAHGLQQTPRAYYDRDRKKVVLLNGFTRRLAYLRLGLPNIAIQFAPRPEDAMSAKLQNGAENMARRNLEPIEIAAWVGDLRADGASEKAIAKAAGGFSGSSIGNYLRFFNAPFFATWLKKYKAGSGVPGVRIALDILQHYRDDEAAQVAEAKRCLELHAEGKPYRVGEADEGEEEEEETDGEADPKEKGGNSTAARLPLRSPAVVKAALEAGKDAKLDPMSFEGGFYAALRWMSFQQWKDTEGKRHGNKSGPPWEWTPPVRGRKKAEPAE